MRHTGSSIRTSTRRPAYDIIAIDEAQDLDLIRIKLLYNLRKNEESKFYIVYDEGQKIYQTTFAASELDSNLKGFRGHGVVFDVNHRNHEDIARFASRLKDGSKALPEGSAAVTIGQAQQEQIADHIAALPSETDTIAVMLWKNTGMDGIDGWYDLLSKKGLEPQRAKDGDDITSPGIYLANLWSIKGLEFDWVIIPQMNDERSYFYHDDQHNNLYFVAFTRARNHLEIYYQNVPHQILLNNYNSLLPKGASNVWATLEPALKAQGLPTANPIEGSSPVPSATEPFCYDDDIPF
jgi:DNA helicase IV